MEPKKNRKAIKIFLILCIGILFMTSCGFWKETMRTERIENIEQADDGQSKEFTDEAKMPEQSEEFSDKEDTVKLPEIPLDFPFPYGKEGYCLALVPSKQAESDVNVKAVEAGEPKAGESKTISYDLRFCDEKGQVIQQFPCCQIVYTGNGQPHTDIPNIEEILRFSYDDLNYDGHEDLQIFPLDEMHPLDAGAGSAGWQLLSATEETSFLGLCFVFNYIWEHENNKYSISFAEDAIEIPAHYENGWRGMLVSEENEDYLEKTIYQANTEKGKCLILRQWILHKPSKVLKIWDWLEERNLFEGKISLDENWEPENPEYYDTLFWDKLPVLRSYSANSTINTWIGGENYGKSADYQNAERFEAMQKIMWGHDGRTAKYPNRQTLLEDFGFWETEPFYEYYNTSGNLQLELYFDSVTEKGCGIRYEYYYTSDLEKEVSMYGFIFDSTYKFQWEEEDAFSTKSWEGTDGSDSVNEYEEQIEYRQNGKPDYYKSQGIIDWISEEEELQPLIEIDWVYRDDGTLYYRDYEHNSFVFGTGCGYIWKYYDEAERPLFERSYITHGSVENYYIYQNAGKKPAYCLNLDDNLGYHIPVMCRYE